MSTRNAITPRPPRASNFRFDIQASWPVDGKAPVKRGYELRLVCMLPDGVKDLIRSGALGHLVTTNADGSAQVTCVWVGLDGDDLLTAHLHPAQQKLKKVPGDPPVGVSFEGTEIQPPGLRHYAVVHGSASIEQGGAPELLQELAHVYLGPEVRFPPMDDPPPGVVVRIKAERVGGIGPWAA